MTTHQEDLHVSAASCIFVKDFADELAAMTIWRSSADGGVVLDIELLALKPRSHEKYTNLRVDVASLLSAEEFGQEALSDSFLTQQCSHSSAEFHEIR